MEAFLLCKLKREKERERKDLAVSLLSSSRVRSVLAVDSVDHGGKQVDAAAAAVLLLWALVADRYSTVHHFNATLPKTKVACLCMRAESWHREDEQL